APGDDAAPAERRPDCTFGGPGSRSSRPGVCDAAFAVEVHLELGAGFNDDVARAPATVAADHHDHLRPRLDEEIGGCLACAIADANDGRIGGADFELAE